MRKGEKFGQPVLAPRQTNTGNKTRPATSVFASTADNRSSYHGARDSQMPDAFSAATIGRDAHQNPRTDTQSRVTSQFMNTNSRVTSQYMGNTTNSRVTSHFVDNDTLFNRESMLRPTSSVVNDTTNPRTSRYMPSMADENYQMIASSPRPELTSEGGTETSEDEDAQQIESIWDRGRASTVI